MADVELLLTGWLRTTLDVRVVTERPADLAAAVPLLWFQRIGGGDNDDNPNFESPTFSVDAFDVDRAGAIALAERAKTAIRSTLPSTLIGVSVITKTQTISGPAWLPYDDPNVRRVAATYRCYVKTRTSV